MDNAITCNSKSTNYTGEFISHHDYSPANPNIKLIRNMKNLRTIDGKSLLIGALLSAVLFLSMGLANKAPQEVRIIGIDKSAFESWDAINVSK